jgi:hypothetical protein
MADPTATGTTILRPGPGVTKEMQDEYYKFLKQILEQYTASNAAAHKQLQALKPGDPVPQGLIDIIEKLCDCKAIVEILNCLCKWLTGG